MSRPEFPSPPCILTSSAISRINSEQAHYDNDPQQAEREQESAEQRRDEEREQERQAEQDYYDEQDALFQEEWDKEKQDAEPDDDSEISLP